MDVLTFSLIQFAVGVPIGAALLMLVARWFKLGESGYLLPLKISAIGGVLNLIFHFGRAFLMPGGNLPLMMIFAVVGFIVSVSLILYLIKSWYGVRDWKTTILVWLVWFALSIVLSSIIGLIISTLVPVPEVVA